MATTQEVLSQIDQALEVARQAFETGSSGGYQAVITHLSQLDAQAREAVQTRLNDHLWPVVEKLENGDSLAAAEQDMLQTFMVGDAKYYVKYEN